MQPLNAKEIIKAVNGELVSGRFGNYADWL